MILAKHYNNYCYIGVLLILSTALPTRQDG